MRLQTSSFWLLLLLILSFIEIECLHLSGTVDTSEDSFFFFLAKFGFQKTEILDKGASQGYIFGNITLPENLSSRDVSNNVMTLAVLDRANFLEYYGNRSLANRQDACEKMFDKINSVAYDSNCNDDGEQDFLRSIPCPRNSLCIEEDNPENVVTNSQFTFKIQDLYQARFWYISLVACRRNVSTCQWEYVQNVKGSENNIKYDIRLVNGNPNIGNKNIFRYQFSSDQQDLLQVYVALLIVYTILTPLQVYAAKIQNHPIARLLAAGLSTQFVALLLINFHFCLFAANGKGVYLFKILGEVLEIISESLFMLLLILLALGWAITRLELTCKITLVGLWSLYTILSCLLYVWMKTEVDVIEDIEEYQTYPGIITLLLRIIVMVGFVMALRDTMLYEYNPDKLNFFLHFGAASLVWFNYLPILAIIALQISALWREKFLIGVSYSVDTFAYAILMHLLWPSRSQQYFLLAVKQVNTVRLLSYFHSCFRFFFWEKQGKL